MFPFPRYEPEVEARLQRKNALTHWRGQRGEESGQVAVTTLLAANVGILVWPSIRLMRGPVFVLLACIGIYRDLSVALVQAYITGTLPFALYTASYTEGGRVNEKEERQRGGREREKDRV